MGEVTYVDEKICVCNNCGAHAENEEGIKHFKTCRPGESEKWIKHYDDAADEEIDTICGRLIISGKLCEPMHFIPKHHHRERAIKERTTFYLLVDDKKIRVSAYGELAVRMAHLKPGTHINIEAVPTYYFGVIYNKSAEPLVNRCGEQLKTLKQSITMTALTEVLS